MSTNTKKKGLLVMHYGTPASIDTVLPYYTHIRRGRPPEPAALQDLIDRYQAIGGPSPLTKISEDQAGLIQKGLERRGIDAALYIGTKHTTPFVADAVEQMAKDGIEDAVGVVLAPHFSSFSIAAYKTYAFGARDQFSPSMSLQIIERWGTLPAFIECLADRVGDQYNGCSPEDTLVIFSAHSLPQRIVAANDPYPEELLETCRLVAEQADILNWTFAYQSASTTGEPWLGPDVLDVISENATKYSTIVCCTVGFVSDHLEVKFDLGIEARDRCAELGLNFLLAGTVNADAKVMDALAEQAAKLYGGE